MDKELEKAIELSGNSLHIETIKLLEGLKENKFDVKVSSYYNDDITGKPREIDIIAEKEIHVSDSKSGKIIETFKIFLFIECKNFTEEIAFWAQQNPREEAISAIVVEGLNKNRFATFNSIDGGHHYITSDLIAKLHFTPKKQENEIFDALTQPVKAICFFKELNGEKGIYYPLVVYSGIDGIYLGNDYEVSKRSGLQKVPIATYSLNYSYRQIRDRNYPMVQRFYVDFVRQDKLQEFIDKTIIPDAIIYRDQAFYASRIGG